MKLWLGALALSVGSVGLPSVESFRASPGRVARTLEPKSASVKIAAFQFSPTELTVSVGDTVVWTNSDAFVHTIKADSGAWSSPELAQGHRFQVATRRAGRFPYHCAAHPVMRGVLVVGE